MAKEKYSHYEFEIYLDVGLLKDKEVHGYIYKIFGTGCPPYDDGLIESDEWYDTEQEARFAAIGHIDLLENGEG
jgi:hypothetical protein